MKPAVPPLQKREAVTGFIWLILHAFFLGDLLWLGFSAFGIDLSFEKLDLLQYIVSALVAVLLLRDFLRENAVRFSLSPRRALLWVLWGYALLLALNYAAAIVVDPFLTDMGPNEEALLEIQEADPTGFFLSTVLLAPIAEELLFRGVLFGTLWKKSRVLAYVVCVFAFGFYHLFYDFLFDFQPALFLHLIFYLLPAFALCYAYEKSGNIYTVILIHVVNNLIATIG